MSAEASSARLSREGPVAIHAQLIDALRGQISGLPAGSRVPTEMELVAAYGVSRTTVRRAVQSLVDAGLLVRRQGKGTFVSEPRMTHPLDRLRPFISMFVGAGKHPDGQVLSYEWLDDLIAPGGSGSGATGALRVRRRYSLDRQPQVVAEIFVPDPFGQQITRAEIEEHPVYQVLLEKLGLVPHHADVTVRSQGASEARAGELGLEVGHPLLVMERVTFDGEGKVIEWATYYLPAERFELRLTVEASVPEAVAYSFTRSGADLMLVTGLPTS